MERKKRCNHDRRMVKKSFEVTDVRVLTENLLPMLLKKAGNVTVGDVRWKYRIGVCG